MSVHVRAGERPCRPRSCARVVVVREFLAEHDPSLPPAGRTLPAGHGRGAARHTIVSLTYDGGVDHGRRPPRHDGQHHRPARHREGLPGRRVQLRRHRRHRGPRGRDGQAVPGRARALREDRGRAALLDGKANRLAALLRGNLGMAMGSRRRPAVRRLRLRRRGRPHLQLRRHRRPLRGAPPPRRRLRLDVRPRLAQGSGATTSTPPTRSLVAVEALLRRRRRRLGHGRSRPARGILPVVVVVDVDGYRRLGDDELDPLVRRVVDARQTVAAPRSPTRT